MKVDAVRKLEPFERFLYWIRERMAVARRRAEGGAKPWTDDEILQRYFFTHPYREMDKVTKWFREKVREPLRDDPRVLLATVIFRWFNLPSTGEILLRRGLLLRWDPALALSALAKVRAAGRPVFTGAYMINSPGGEPKLEAIVRRVTNVWNERGRLQSIYAPSFPINGGEPPPLQALHAALTEFDGMGGFMAYEVVTDLRHTYLGENAPDVLTWCNPGPGCARGLLRLAAEDFEKGNNSTSPKLPRDWLERMRKLRGRVARRLDGLGFPPFEMRELEHSLCEFDKFERALWGDGRLKRTYPGAR